VVKAPDFYHGEKNKFDSFLMSMDIYILFNAYLFGTEAAKVVYAISYLHGISFNWVKTYIDDFIAHKLLEGRVTTAARTTTQCHARRCTRWSYDCIGGGMRRLARKEPWMGLSMLQWR
jgi:hypothetical protein